MYKKENINFKKSLGQHFLISEKVTRRIIQECNLKKKEIVLEIGAGIGNLTKYLLDKCDKVIAVEKDRNLIKILKDKVKSSNLEIICEDILNLNIRNFAKERKIKVIGNLPYYISSDILKHLIEYRKNISYFYGSLQKEFANRLVAKPNSKDYSRLTLLINYYTVPEILFNIKSSCFFPAPAITSSFIKLTFHSKPCVEVVNEKLFFEVIKRGFSTRRKKLVNCLISLPGLKISKKNLYLIFEQLNITSNTRAENLDINNFARLSNILYKNI